MNEVYILRVESEQKERKAYIKGTNDADELCNKKWKDKIKAKIEELEIEQESNRENLKIAIDNLIFSNMDKRTDRSFAITFRKGVDMKYIKILGIKDYLLYKILQFLEYFINTPYIIIKSIIEILYVIFDALDDLFSEKRIIKLRKFKKIDNFHKECYDKLRKDSRTYKLK